MSLFGHRVALIDVNGCHNPETWDFNGGIEIEYKDLSNKILKAINANGIIRNFSILGGEPLCPENINLVSKILEDIKSFYPNIKIYCWTGGTYEELIKEEKYFKALNYTDILVDGQFILEKRDLTLKFKGSSNQRVIDVQKSLQENKVILYKGEELWN